MTSLWHGTVAGFLQIVRNLAGLADMLASRYYDRHNHMPDESQKRAGRNSFLP